MLIKEILETIGLNIYLPDNLLNEDLGDITPKEYVRNRKQYIIRFKDSTFEIIINTDGSEEYCIMTETFEDIRNSYVSYNIDGELQCIA